jgi:hypothetical protein
MIRRLARVVVAGFCLVSLLVAMGVGWLWRESRQGRGYSVEFALARRCVEAGSSANSGQRIWLRALWRWPGSPSLRVGSDSDFHTLPFYELVARSQTRQWLGLEGESGDLMLAVRPDTGEPIRWRRELMFTRLSARSSQPVAFCTIRNIPHPAIIGATMMAPLVWAGTRWRHARQLRRRRRLGLCLACGFDLRRSPARCPECGAVAASKGAAA